MIGNSYGRGQGDSIAMGLGQVIGKYNWTASVGCGIRAGAGARVLGTDRVYP